MGTNTHGCSSQSQYQRSNSEISGNSGPNNRPSQSSRSTNYNYDYRKSQRQPHARYDERHNQRYSPLVFPLNLSLNSSSQEVQAAAYKEMTKTNKMKDDNALFHSIEVYDGPNPTKFGKWIDSIDQATHITGRNLRKELLKKSDGVIRNTLSLMDDRWSDDAIITK